MFKPNFAVALLVLGISFGTKASAAEIYDWSGAYIGAHAGYGWAKPEWDLSNFGPIEGPLEDMKDKSFLGGVHVGYSFQQMNWVLGIEASISAGKFKSAADACEFMCAVGTKVAWTGDIAGRVGYAVDRSLIYVRGGAALADVKSFYTFGGLNPFNQTLSSDKRIRVGWTLGAGFEYALSRHVSASLDYRYANFGTDDSDLHGRFTIDHFDRSLSMQTVMVGLNYRF